MSRLLVVLFVLAGALNQARAAVSLLDSDWKIQLYGFVEQDVIKDSTRSFTEVMGNGPGGKPGAGPAADAADNGRVQFSNRNSRLGFILGAPEQDGWKTTAKTEFDFLGYTPAAFAGPSESQFYGYGAFRIRLMNAHVEKDGMSLIFGQDWSLFGWQPTYVPPTVSVPPAPGVLYQRTGMFGVMKKFNIGSDSSLTGGLTLERPSQTDSGMPNIAFGAKYINENRKSGFNSTYSDEKAEPMSVAVSGIVKQFEHSDSLANGFSNSRATSTALAVDTLLPILSSGDGKPGNTLTFIGEFSSGQGYADELPSWAGTAATSGAANIANLDGGYAGIVNATGQFTLLNLQTWNASFQYHFSDDSHSWITLGASHMHSNNANGAYSNAGTYWAADYKYVNFYHDCTKAIRVAAEYSKDQTTFNDNTIQNNDRYQLTALFRF